MPKLSEYPGDHRFEEFKLEAHERPKYMYQYYVTGNGSFPIDMLRHDLCWPATGEDAAKIDQHCDTAFVLGRRNRDLVSIKLRSYRKPTVDRWMSFTWSVGFRAVVVEE